MRTMLSLVMAVAVAITFGGLRGSSAAEEHAMINVGLQLYSLRDRMSKDVPATLEIAHKMGITDVEVAGFGNLNAEQFHQQLVDHQLQPSGIHFQWDRFTTDLPGVIKDCKTFNVEYVTMPWIPHNGKFTIDDAKKAVTAFNEWGRKCSQAGIHFTYHPHGYEFSPYENGTLFDYMVANTDPQFVNFELDIFWAYDGGADPVKLMEKYPNRFPLMHLKDMRKDIKTPNYTGHEDTEADVALGKGQIDIPAILHEAVKIGVKHYYIEDESKESVEQVPVSVQFVRSIGL